MLLLKLIFVLLHILTASAWFGLGLRLAAQARRITVLAPEAAKALAEDVQATVRQMNGFVMATLVFALGALFSGGGFAVYGAPYHTSLLLLLVLIALQWGVIRPTWAKLYQAVTEAPEQLEVHRKRIAIATGIGHLLWVIILVLMYWSQLVAAWG
jgi:hypothetical protein